MNEKALIWVDKEFEEKYKSIGDEQEQAVLFQAYMDKVSQQSKDEYKANLEAMEEDVAIYTGLMLKVKQAFGKAKDEALTASYDLWENYAKEKPKTEANIDNLVALLNPLEAKLEHINKMINSIETYNINKVADTIQRFNELSAKGEEMFSFLVKHFKEKVTP